MTNLRPRALAIGIVAILIWVALFLCAEWLSSVGYWGYLRIAIPVAMVLSILFGLSPTVRRMLSQVLPQAIERVLSVYDEGMGWVVGLLLALSCGVVVYFLLTAPYGILCHLGLKHCGQ